MTDSSRPYTSLPTLFDLSHSNRYMVLSYSMVVLTCISLATNDVEHLLICFFASFLLELSVFLLGFVSSLCILVMSFVRYMGWKYFLPVCSLSFLSLKNVFSRAEAFNFGEVLFIIFFFYGSCVLY